MVSKLTASKVHANKLASNQHIQNPKSRIHNQQDSSNYSSKILSKSNDGNPNFIASSFQQLSLDAKELIPKSSIEAK